MSKPLSERAKRINKRFQELELERQKEKQVSSGLSQYENTMAQLSDLAYKPPAARKKIIRDLNASGGAWEIDNELSGKKEIVIVDKNTGKTIVSHRGTQLKDAQDLGSDMLIATGLENLSLRFKNADKHMNKVLDKYGRDNVEITGHSLGGTISNYLARRHDLTSHSFNPGSGIGAVRGLTNPNVVKENQKGNVIHYKTNGIDPISELGLFGADEVREIEKKDDLHPHLLSNFL